MVWFLLAININSNEPVILEGPFSTYTECRDAVFEARKTYDALKLNSNYKQLRVTGRLSREARSNYGGLEETKRIERYYG